MTAKPPSARQRLDLTMVARGLAPTRSQARDLIARGCVTVGGAAETKSGALVSPSDAITVAEGAGDYVSRGALKLAAALDAFKFSTTGAIALDVGASTGGFTQVLLARGAAKVYAVDVGHGQLHPRLAADARVVSLERCDARHLYRALIPDPVDAIVADVSFISLTKALPAPLALAAPSAWLIVLVKPQFEAGRGAIGKGGIVRDPEARDGAVATATDWIARQPGWDVVGALPSPVAGGSGNVEILLGAVRHG
jgi:23S rRNA (cytidine1920-2'-O)/16S rRNA (cytidine1409-2'-O)-methyltransferase